MMTLQFISHVTVIIILFTLQTTVFSPLVIPVNIDLMFVYALYLCFYGRFIRSVALLMIAAQFLESASSAPLFFHTTFFLMSYLAVRYATLAFMSVTQFSITLFTAAITLGFGLAHSLVFIAQSRSTTEVADHFVYLPLNIAVMCLLQPFMFFIFQVIDSYFHERMAYDRRDEELFFRTSWWKK